MYVRAGSWKPEEAPQEMQRLIQDLLAVPSERPVTVGLLVQVLQIQTGFYLHTWAQLQELKALLENAEAR